nr:hypothetical protein BaRGS_014535 [Batillaria attramentaria]
MEGLFRSVSTAITDRFYSFFSLAAAVSPDDVPEEEEGQDMEEGEEEDGEERLGVEEAEESTELDVSQRTEFDNNRRITVM